NETTVVGLSFHSRPRALFTGQVVDCNSTPRNVRGDQRMRISGTSRLCGLETGSGFLALCLGCYVNRPSLERPERGDGHGAILDDLADQARNHHLQRLRGPEALGE